MNITLKDVPEELHSRLKHAADQSGRSLNKFILVELEQAFSPRLSSRPALIKRIRSRRDRMEPFVTDSSLRNAIEQGRE